MITAVLAVLAAGQAADSLAERLGRAHALFETCAQAAREERRAPGLKAAEAAETIYRQLARLRPRDPEPLVGHARALTQCRLPFASAFGKAELYQRSSDLLERALALDSTHWGARYALALGHYHAPRFFGRTRDAVREFETLLRQQGNATDFEELAAPYAYLGDLYVRLERREDAIAIWRRGATLFPADPRLRRRLERSGAGR